MSDQPRISFHACHCLASTSAQHKVLQYTLSRELGTTISLQQVLLVLVLFKGRTAVRPVLWYKEHSSFVLEDLTEPGAIGCRTL